MAENVSGAGWRRRGPINLSAEAFRHLAAALGVAALLGAGQARADWTLVDANQKEQAHVTINSWTPSAGLSMSGESGALTTLPTREVVSLSSGREVVANPESRGWKLTLRNGDVLFGEAVEVSGQSLIFKAGDLGRVTVPLKYAAKLSAPKFDGQAENGAAGGEQGAADHDVVIFKTTGDRLEGLFNKVDANNVQMLVDTPGVPGAGGVGGAAGGDSTPTEVPLGKIEAVVFGGVAAPRGIPPLSARVTFSSGSRLTVPLDEAKGGFSWSIGTLSMKDPGGQTVTSNVDQIVKVEVVGGRVVYLTDLDPAKDEQVSFFGTAWPSRVNLNVMGMPLKVGRTTFSRGLGVHTQSTLVYELDGSFETLSIKAGLDDSAAPNGEAHPYIVLDGKTIWDGKVMKPGEISPELNLPIKGGRKLELHADPAGRLDVQGRVDWVEAALRRK